MYVRGRRPCPQRRPTDQIARGGRPGSSPKAADAALSGTASAPAKAHDAPASGRRKTVCIQVSSVSFVDEGAEPVLDVLQERGRVDTIYLTTFTCGRGLAGRQVPGQPFPDHGVQQSDQGSFHGGDY